MDILQNVYQLLTLAQIDTCITTVFTIKQNFFRGGTAKWISK